MVTSEDGTAVLAVLPVATIDASSTATAVTELRAQLARNVSDGLRAR